MPELPEVEALRGFLSERLTGHVIRCAQLLEIAALKTYSPRLEDLAGRRVGAVERRGKFLALGCDPVDGDAGEPVTPDRLWLVFHLARGGWLTWKDSFPATPPRPGKGPYALRLALADGGGFELTEHGTQKRLAIYVVRALAEVPGVAMLGPDPLGADFDRDRLAGILGLAGAAHVKGVLRDQSRVAGIGNAYSDEILHAARLSPFAAANRLDDDVVTRLEAAIRSVLGDAVERASGRAARELKDAKRSGMRVHGRTGEPCPVCGDTVAEVRFADSSLQYCPTCQTGGRKLADRRMSRLLK